MIPSRSAIGGRLHTNVSRMLAFQRCPQYFAYRYEQGLVPLAERRAALDIGSAVHEGLRALYVERVGAEEAIERALATLEQESEERAYVKDLLGAYCRYWLDDLDRWVVLMAETEMSKVIERDGQKAVLHGRPDLVVQDLQLGGVWHVQHKTVGGTVGLENYVQKYDLAWHERAYALMLRERYPAYKGTVLNVLRKLKRPAASAEHFKRFYVPVGEEQVERFERDALKTCEWIATGERPQFTESCFLYNQLCAYHPLCMGQEVWEDQWKAREEDYVDRAVTE